MSEQDPDRGAIEAGNPDGLDQAAGDGGSSDIQYHSISFYT